MRGITKVITCLCGALAMAQADTIEVSKKGLTILTFPSNFDFSANGNADAFIESFPQGTASQSAKSIVFLRYNDVSPLTYDQTNYTVYTKDGFAYDFILRLVEYPRKSRFSLTREMADNLDDITMVSQGAKRTIFSDENLGPIKVEAPNHHYQGEGISDSGTEISKHAGKAKDTKDDISYATDKEEYVRQRCYYNQFYKGNILKYYEKKYGMELWLKGIYYDREELYFQFRLENNSGIDYDVNFIKTFIGLKKGKKNNGQPLEFSPRYTYKVPKRIVHKTENYFFLVFDKFSIEKGKSLIIELNEAKGGRHITMSVSPEMIYNAKGFKQ